MKHTRLKLLKTIPVILTLLTASLWAQEGAPQAPNPLGGFLPLIVIFVIFYFFLIRPQQKKAKEHQKMLNALKKDDKILTAGGIYGSVTGVKGEIIEVKIAEGVKVNVAKSAISAVLPPEGQQPVTPEIVK
ncbi:MAG: preprotein translocase subunit YajC [Endomicrobiales bacterium]